MKPAAEGVRMQKVNFTRRKDKCESCRQVDRQGIKGRSQISQDTERQTITHQNFAPIWFPHCPV